MNWDITVLYPNDSGTEQIDGCTVKSKVYIYAKFLVVFICNSDDSILVIILLFYISTQQLFNMTVTVTITKN